MPLNRMRPTRWLAARRAAKRRSCEPLPSATHHLSGEPLPPLVSPDDDREFVEPRRTLLPVVDDATGLSAALGAPRMTEA